MGIFQPAMLVYQRVGEIPNPLIRFTIDPHPNFQRWTSNPPSIPPPGIPPPAEEMRIQEHSSFGERTIPSALSPFWYVQKICPEKNSTKTHPPEVYIIVIHFFGGPPERLPKGPPKKKGSVGSASQFRQSIEQKVFCGKVNWRSLFHIRESWFQTRCPRKHQLTSMSDECTESHERVNHSTEFSFTLSNEV